MKRRFKGVEVTLVCLFLSLAACGCPQQAPQASRAPERRGPSAPVEPCPVPAVALVETPVYQPIAGRTVILDAGHGGQDLGAAHFGLCEKDINLDLALRAAQLLRAKGVAVHMTRDRDVFVPLPDRSAFANRFPNSILVSVHVNASETNPGAHGVETFVLSNQYKDADRGRLAAKKYKMNGSDPVQGKQALANLAVRSRTRGPALATSLQRSLSARLGEPDRGVKTGDLHMLRETYFCPAVLVEVGFLTHAPSAARMRTEDWRRRTAEALAEGVAEFLRQPE